MKDCKHGVKEYHAAPADMQVLTTTPPPPPSPPSPQAIIDELRADIAASRAVLQQLRQQ